MTKVYRETVKSLQNSAPAEEIRRQYRLLSEQYHPGRYAAQGPEYVQMASEKLREIQRAYETLKAHGRV